MTIQALIDILHWPKYLGLPVGETATFFKTKAFVLPYDGYLPPFSMDETQWLMIGTSFGFIAIFDLEFNILLQAFKLEGFFSISSIAFIPKDWDDTFSLVPIKKYPSSRPQHSTNLPKLFEEFFNRTQLKPSLLSHNQTTKSVTKHTANLETSSTTEVKITLIKVERIRFIVAGKTTSEPHCLIFELSTDGATLQPICLISHLLELCYFSHFPNVKQEGKSTPLRRLNILSLLNRTGIRFPSYCLEKLPNFESKVEQHFNDKHDILLSFTGKGPTFSAVFANLGPK